MNNISSSIPTQSDYMSIVKTLDKNDSTSEVTTEQNLKGRRVSFFDESSASIHMMDLLPHPLLTDVDYSNDDGMEIEEVDDNVLLQLDSKTKGRRVSLEPTQLIRFDMIPSPIDFEDDINIDNLEDEETKIAANKDVTTKSDSHKIASTLEDQKREDPPKRRHSEKTLEKLKEILSRGPSLSKRRRSTRSEAHIDCSEDEKEDFVDDDEEYIPTSKKPLLSINSRSSKKSSDSSFGQSGTEKVTVKRNSVNKDDVLSGRGMASSSHPGNIRFRNLIHAEKRSYESNIDKKFRRGLAKKIVDTIHPGRFIKIDVGKSKGYVLSYELSIRKALYAMRDTKFDSSSSKKSSTSLKPVDSKVDTVVKTTNYSTPPICKRSLTQSPDLTKAPKKAKVEENEETYSPKRIGGKLTLSEIAVVKLLIETSIASPGEAFLTKNPKSRSEEIFAYIEKLVAAGAKARCNERKEIIEAYLHPQMQRCIRLELLKRCEVNMDTTEIGHTEFFDNLLSLGLFP